MEKSPWVLCVDDERRVLEAIEQHFAFDYEVRTATNGVEALALLEEHPGCAVVVTDMRMPGMTGAELLAQIRERSPQTTRVLLTGQASLDAAVEAVNRGGIYRFLIKPCPIDLLGTVIADGLEQYQLRAAEQELIQGTLRGTIQILIDVLGVTSPLAFSRAEVVRAALVYAGERLGLPISWEGELAALLARLGWISVPPDVLEHYIAGQPLSDEGLRMMANAKQLAGRLLRPVPRLGPVAALIDAIGTAPPGSNPLSLPPEAGTALLLSVALELDRRAMRGEQWDKCAAELAPAVGSWVYDAFRGYDVGSPGGISREVMAKDLVARMVVEHPVRTLSGTMILPEGTQLTPLLLARLKNFARGIGVVEPIKVRVPQRGVVQPTVPRLPTYVARRPTKTT